jgi:hypothetical protein
MTPPNAYTAVILTNLGNGAESVILTWGGSNSQILTLPAMQNQSALYINNFSPANLNVFNQGPASTIGAQVAGFGQGGISPVPIANGTPLSMAANSYAQGTSSPNTMNLSLTTTTGALTTFVIMGGTTPSSQGSTTRAVVIQLNSGSPVGPTSGTMFNNASVQPTGSSLDAGNQLVYAATASATYNLLYNWGASSIWIANASASTATGASITLTSLG